MIMTGDASGRQKIKEKGVPVSHDRETGTFMAEGVGRAGPAVLFGPSGSFPPYHSVMYSGI
jgi:hypothetical protein